MVELNEKGKIVLRRSVISEPLHELLIQRSQSNDKAKPVPVIIDLNLKYQSGLKKADEDVRKWLADRNERVDDRKTELSAQHMIADLRPETILAMAEWTTGRDRPTERPIYRIWPDFELEPHIMRSAATVKADAAHRSFIADGSGIVWAVLDSGIDQRHEHFRRYETLRPDLLHPSLRHMDFTASHAPDPTKLGEVGEAERVASLTDDFGHGTHVAGIIAGEYRANGGTPAMISLAERRVETESAAGDGEEFYTSETADLIQGIAPRCKLLSMKVLDHNGRGTVSNVLAAIAQIQKINEHGRYIKIHGVNISLGHGFNPRWFACGQSPLCVEVNRLVASGVVVIVSAGNSGYGQRVTVMEGQQAPTIRSGMLMTINDPGNAQGAITVGATHRHMPHVYGTSYFSSKGPTGDGRRKPDLVAPGERIVSCAAGREANKRGLSISAGSAASDRLYVDMSGTSMAAPHVSGAIAAFLSIRSEFIGQPERIKQVFKDSATDLGREPYMQGAGLIDLMRAIQTI